MVGCDRERGRNAKCVTIEDKTWLHVQCIWPWQYHLSSCWCNYWKLHISVSSLYGQGQIWIPASGWSLLSRVPAHRSSATPPPPLPKRAKLMLPNPLPSRQSGTGIKAVWKQQLRPTFFQGHDWLTNYLDSEFHGHWKTVTLPSISPNLSKHWRFLAFWLRLCFGSCLNCF